MLACSVFFHEPISIPARPTKYIKCKGTSKVVPVLN